MNVSALTNERPLVKVLSAVLPLALGMVIAFGVNPLINVEWKAIPEQREGGVLVRGDSATKPTTFLDHFLIFWPRTAVFQVAPEALAEGYQVGYTAFNGESCLQNRIFHEPFFRVRIGGEDCLFFVLSPQGRPLPLTLVAQTTRGDDRYAFAPLH